MLSREELLSMGYDNEYLNHLDIVGGEEKKSFERKLLKEVKNGKEIEDKD